MAKRTFKTIGLIGRPRSPESADTLQKIYDFLLQKHYQIVIDQETATLFQHQQHPVLPREQFAQDCDLVIVVGGDGSMLTAARAVLPYQTPVLGINRGRLGFLTDINPSELPDRIDAVLRGNYIEERRFLLATQIINHGKIEYENIVLNDVVLLPGDYAHMIEFDIYIDKQMVCTQRADGQIIATPTGSTAYALSGGGPILHPSLGAVVLVPMFPHTLSARPIVVECSSAIELVISLTNETSPKISCDGLARIAIAPGASLHVRKNKDSLILLHPTDYNYFETLRSKLHWQTKL